jgi:hypothetical protein
MPSLIVPAGGRAEISAAASDKIAIYSEGDCVLNQLAGFPNYPSKESLIAFIPNSVEYVSAAVSAATTLILDNSGNPFPALYEVGTAPTVRSDGLKGAPIQAAPIALDATGAVTAAMILGGIVTSAAQAVTATLPTGAVLEAATDFAVNDSVDWSVIKVGANAFTVQVADSHTVVGSLTVATATSARFRTRKVSAGVFETYRLS